MPDELIATALGRTAELLEDRFPAGHALKEKQFEQCFEATLETASAARILPSANLKLTHWRKAYAIDTMAMLPGGHTLAAELKWGVGTLYNCSWDLAKLGVALGEGAAEVAYLVAGAPAGEWAAALGAELFDAGIWRPGDLRQRFKKHFDFWAKDVPTTGPINVPAGTETAAVSVVELPKWDGEWTLRASRVEVVDSVWISWNSLAG